MKQEKQYKLVNLITLLFAVGWFIVTNWKKDSNWQFVSKWAILIIILTSIFVHSIKILRLYLILYGKGVSFTEHVKQYCKVIPISMIFPFKLGEFFRMYCYGWQINNFFDGIIVILVDRFIDTLGLVTIILFISVVGQADFPFILYILLCFLAIIIICYLIFPSIYFYWKHELLRAKVSRRKNNMLYFLEKLYYAYFELAILIKGRFTVLYLFSLFAWAIEIGGGFICSQFVQHTETTFFISDYLTSALLEVKSDALKRFVLISILLLLVFYLILRTLNIFIRKKERKC